MNITEIVHVTKTLTDIGIDVNIVPVILSYLTYDPDTFVFIIAEPEAKDPIAWCPFDPDNTMTEIKLYDPNNEDDESKKVVVGVKRMPLYMRHHLYKKYPQPAVEDIINTVTIETVYRVDDGRFEL